jgi:hypothetical protein
MEPVVSEITGQAVGERALTERLVRRWIRLYTHGLPPEAAARRRAELESDLWEHLHDDQESHASLTVLGRCLRGIAADLWWRARTLVATRAERRATDPAPRRNAWVVFTALVAAALLVTSLGGALAGADGATSAWALAGSAGAVASSGLIVAGLVLLTRTVVLASWLVVAGCIAAGPFAWPVTAAVVISGLWSANLLVSEPAQGTPRLVVARRQRLGLTRRWYLWVAAGAVLFAFGMLFPLVVFNPSVTGSFGEEADGAQAVVSGIAWMTWWGSWMAAGVITGIGVLLGIVHLAAQRVAPRRA